MEKKDEMRPLEDRVADSVIGYLRHTWFDRAPRANEEKPLFECVRKRVLEEIERGQDAAPEEVVAPDHGVLRGVSADEVVIDDFPDDYVVEAPELEVRHGDRMFWLVLNGESRVYVVPPEAELELVASQCKCEEPRGCRHTLAAALCSAHRKEAEQEREAAEEQRHREEYRKMQEWLVLVGIETKIPDVQSRLLEDIYVAQKLGREVRFLR